MRERWTEVDRNGEVGVTQRSGVVVVVNCLLSYVVGYDRAEIEVALAGGQSASRIVTEAVILVGLRIARGRV